MTTGLERIAAKARADRKLKFTSLAHHLTEELVWESVNHIPNNSAPGCDGQTVEEAKQSFKQWAPEMIRAIHDEGYRPPPILRVFIPKPGKKEKRPLGIPTVADRLLQRAVARILEAVFEADFLECSHGFRPGRNPHHALQALRVQIVTKKAMQVFEADIRSYFTRINRQWLRKMVAHRIADPVILSLILGRFPKLVRSCS